MVNLDRNKTRSWKVIIASSILTFTIFSSLPLINYSKKENADQLKLYDVSHVELIPPPLQLSRVQQKETMQKKITKPILAEPYKPIPIKNLLNISTDQKSAVGKIDFNFLSSALLDTKDYAFGVTEIDQQPQLLAGMQPLYPLKAQINKIEGEIHLEFIVDSNGSVRDIKVIDATPKGIFENASRLAVQRWKFQPGSAGGQPAPVRVKQTISFTLKK